MDEDDHLVREEGGCLECLHQRLDGRHLLIADERIGALVLIWQEAAQDCLLCAADIVALLSGEEKDVRQLSLCERGHKVCAVHRM